MLTALLLPLALTPAAPQDTPAQDSDLEARVEALEAEREAFARQVEILAMELAGADPETVQRVCRLVDIAEFKRRQTPLGTRITAKAFGRDRRIPIINRYRG